MENIKFDSESFLAILKDIMAHSRQVQNNPPQCVPQEKLVANHVLAALKPYSYENGGPLGVEYHEYVENRGNVVVEYKCSNPNARSISFVGCHMDVVPANPDEWDFDPFTLGVNGDELRGRGVTDCLGHVALVTELFKSLGQHKPQLNINVYGVFIANEENSSRMGIGVDELVKRGVMERCKAGPVIWIDSADKNPCIGTGGMCVWTLKGKGKLFHSGLAHKAINPMEMVMEALAIMQKRFYEDFPTHPDEARYGFITSSTCKPTQWLYPGGGVNQIPAECEISGDCRIVPFYEVDDVEAALRRYIDDINKDLSCLPTRGPASKYELPDEGLKGKVEIEFEGGNYPGIACNLDSEGHHLLRDASEKVMGACKPFSLTGSLPLVKDLQRAGFDIQIVGYGRMGSYHAKNEVGSLNDFNQGFDVLSLMCKMSSEKNA